MNWVDPLGFDQVPSAGERFLSGLGEGFKSAFTDMADLGVQLFDYLFGNASLPSVDGQAVRDMLAGVLQGVGEALVSKFPPALVAYLLARVGIEVYGNWYCDDFAGEFGKGVGKALGDTLIGFLGGKILKGLLRKLKLKRVNKKRAKSQAERRERHDKDGKASERWKNVDRKTQKKMNEAMNRFGKGEKGARKLLEEVEAGRAKRPEGLSRKAVELYRDSVKARHDKLAKTSKGAPEVMKARLKIYEHWLGE